MHGTSSPTKSASLLSTPTGRRDLNKADKRRRIREAALTLFSSKGYEATTVRQIARRAKVALGTLSLYADDKRDLVLLIFNEMIPKVIEEGRAAAGKKTMLLDRLLAFYGPFYENINRNITLARIHHQLNFYSTGSHTAEYNKLRARMFDCIEDIVRDAQASGQIARTNDSRFIARYIFLLQSAAVRWWVASSQPKPQVGLNDLSELLKLTIRGLKGKSKTTRTLQKRLNDLIGPF